MSKYRFSPQLLFKHCVITVRKYINYECSSPFKPNEYTQKQIFGTHYHLKLNNFLLTLKPLI